MDGQQGLCATGLADAQAYSAADVTVGLLLPFFGALSVHVTPQPVVQVMSINLRAACHAAWAAECLTTRHQYCYALWHKHGLIPCDKGHMQAVLNLTCCVCAVSCRSAA